MHRRLSSILSAKGSEGKLFCVAVTVNTKRTCFPTTFSNSQTICVGCAATFGHNLALHDSSGSVGIDSSNWLLLVNFKTRNGYFSRALGRAIWMAEMLNQHSLDRGSNLPSHIPYYDTPV